jgi:hypothetical protein
MPLDRTTHIVPPSIRIFYKFPSNLIRSSYPRNFNPSRLLHYFIVTLCLALILLILLASIIIPLVLTFPKTRRARTDLPTVEGFLQDNGTKWHIEYVGDITFTGPMGDEGLGGDKCRSSLLAGRHIWNCGDMMWFGAHDLWFRHGPCILWHTPCFCHRRGRSFDNLRLWIRETMAC